MRRPTVLTLVTAVVVALPLGAVAPVKAQESHRPAEPDRHSSAGLLEAVQMAADQRQARAQTKEASGIPSDRTRRKELDRAADQVVAEGALGLTARVESPDFDWRGSAGRREVDHRPPAQPQDRFRVGSITKTIVSTLVMQEVEAGTFTLQTPVDEIVPGLFPDQPDVTVEHLLSHRSGVQTSTDALVASRMDDLESWEDFFAAIGQDYTIEEYLSVANALPWLFEPGTDFSYANAGYVALGVLLEEVTGEDLGDLLEDRVLRPAGMRHTSYPDEPGTRGPFLVGAAWTGTEAEAGVGWVSLEGFDPDVFAAAGAAVSTTKDLNAFTEALVTGQFLDPALVQEMVTPRTVGSQVIPDYGLGVFRVPDPCTGAGEPQEWLYGHDGGTYGGQALALTSADGSRQLSLGVTGRDLTQQTPLYDVTPLLVPMLLATC